MARAVPAAARRPPGPGRPLRTPPAPVVGTMGTRPRPTPTPPPSSGTPGSPRTIAPARAPAGHDGRATGAGGSPGPSAAGPGAGPARLPTGPCPGTGRGPAPAPSGSP